MLIYHPAFDQYHCIFRVMRLLAKLPMNPIEVDRLRILDFYLLFPSAANDMRFPINMQKYKKLAGKKNKYDSVRDPIRIFLQLEPFQRAGIKEIAARGFISSEHLENGKILATGKQPPPSLTEKINSANNEDAALVNWLTGPMVSIDLYGQSGLRGRTNLFQYRYDPA